MAGVAEQKVLDAALAAAVKRRDVQGVAQLLARGADVNMRVENRPLLSYAAGEGMAGIVTLALDHGADIHATCAAFFSPLHMAVQNMHFNIADILLARGADINFQRNPRFSNAPLHLAVHCDARDGGPRYERLYYLLSHGADPAVIMTRDNVEYRGWEYATAYRAPKGELIDAYIAGWTERRRKDQSQRAAMQARASKFKLRGRAA